MSHFANMHVKTPEWGYRGTKRHLFMQQHGMNVQSGFKNDDD